MSDLPDVNVLVALLHPQHVHHQAADDWFSGTPEFRTTPITEAGFIRVVLNPAVTQGTVDSHAAMASLTSVRSDPRWSFLADDSSLASAAIDLVGLAGFRQVTDLHLVNLAATSGTRIVTFDARISPVLVPEDQHLVLTLS